MGDRLFTQPAALGTSGAVCAATGTGLLGSTVTPTVALPAQATAVTPVAMVAGTGMPTRTDLLNWDHQHLTQAGTAWWNQAQAWEDSFYTICKEVHNPAGTQWTGITAAAAQAASLADLHQVSDWAEHLREAARVARFGASAIEHAKYAAESAAQTTFDETGGIAELPADAMIISPPA